MVQANQQVGVIPGLKISLTGRSTCASASALSLDAQPAQLDRLVRRICFPEECEAFHAGIYTVSRGMAGFKA